MGSLFFLDATKKSSREAPKKTPRWLPFLFGSKKVCNLRRPFHPTTAAKLGLSRPCTQCSPIFRKADPLRKVEGDFFTFFEASLLMAQFAYMGDAIFKGECSKKGRFAACTTVYVGKMKQDARTFLVESVIRGGGIHSLLLNDDWRL